MAIKFTGPKTKVISTSKSALEVKEKNRRKRGQKTYQLLPEDPRRPSNQKPHTRGVHKKSIGRIYPDFTYKKNLHPTMIALWTYLKNPKHRQKLGVNPITCGFAKDIWEWVYKHTPHPVGALGGPLFGNKANGRRSGRVGIIPYDVLGDVSDTIKVPKPKKPKDAPSDPQPTSTEIIPTV